MPKRFNKGDLVCVIPYDEINPEEVESICDDGWDVEDERCYGITRSEIDKAAGKPFHVVQYGGSDTCSLENSPYSWLNCMLRPYVEEEFEAEAPERIFTSLFGTDVEVWR